MSTWRVAALSMLTVLAGCAAPRPAVDPAVAQARLDERRAALSEIPGWDLDARVALSDGSDGGSGSLSWRYRPERMTMQFRGRLGRGGWELVSDRFGAVLRTADGHYDRDESLSALIARNAGWSIPVEGLFWWIQGLPAPWPARELDLGPDGEPVSLLQDGWRIEYGDYEPLGGATVPERLVARSGDKHVKVAVADWRIVEPTEDG